MLDLSHFVNVSDKPIKITKNIPRLKENGLFFAETTYGLMVIVINVDDKWTVLTKSNDDLEEEILSNKHFSNKKIDVDFIFDDIRIAEREVITWLKTGEIL